MKGRQDTGRGKLFTCYIKMKYVSKLSEIWSWKLRSNSYWRSELINFLFLTKSFRKISLPSGTTRRCLTSTTRSRPWRSSGVGRSRTWPRSPFDQRLTRSPDDQVEARLAIIGGERDLIVKEQAEEEARIRNAKLEELKRRR